MSSHFNRSISDIAISLGFNCGDARLGTSLGGGAGVEQVVYEAETIPK
jgi:hypothetical protein